MNRIQRRQHAKQVAKVNEARPGALTAIPPEKWPKCDEAPGSARVAVWHSRSYLCQLFTERPLPAQPNPIAVCRITVCRTTIDVSGKWLDRITWEELQDVKRQLGFADWYAVEVYPRDFDLVNVANMRHLWLLETPLPIGWFTHGQKQSQQAGPVEGTATEA